MTFEERNQWAYGLAALLVGGTYLAWLGTRVAATDNVADIAYAGNLVRAIVAGVVVNIVFSIVARGAGARGADRTDERDRNVGRRADQIAYVVFSLLVIGPFVLAVADAPTFWIANAIYAAYVMGAVTSVIARSVIYRKGI